MQNTPNLTDPAARPYSAPMSTSITASTLTVTVEEAITLGGVSRGSKTTLSITGVREVSERVFSVLDTIAAGTTETKLLQLDTVASAGSWARADLKYARITNLHGTATIRLHVVGAHPRQDLWTELGPGQSALVYKDTIKANSEGPNAWTVGTTVFDNPIDYIAAQTEEDAGVDVEVFVASA